MPAKVTILVEGYYEMKGGQEHACATITLVQDGDLVMVVDPGTLKDQQILIDALEKEDLDLDDVTVVCLTHSHIDHYRNVGMFGNAKVLEYFGLWSQDAPQDWKRKFTDNIQIIKTPGHDYSCITLFVTTDDGVVAICGDVFWKENYPNVDPYATDLKKLEQSRRLVLGDSHWIIPGHAGMYKTQNGHKLQKAKAGAKTKPAVLGRCKKCHRPFFSQEDKCICQEWLCHHCCECAYDCATCNCSYKR